MTTTKKKKKEKREIHHHDNNNTPTTTTLDRNPQKNQRKIHIRTHQNPLEIKPIRTYTINSHQNPRRKPTLDPCRKSISDLAMS